MVNKPQNLRNGFEATGIWPLNRNRILYKVNKRGIYQTVSNEQMETENLMADESSIPSDVVVTPSTSTAPDATFIEETNRKMLVKAVKDTLKKTPDETAKKAIENSKINFRIKKKSGELLTSDKAVAALKLRNLHRKRKTIVKIQQMMRTLTKMTKEKKKNHLLIEKILRKSKSVIRVISLTVWIIVIPKSMILLYL